MPPELTVLALAALLQVVPMSPMPSPPISSWGRAIPCPPATANRRARCRISTARAGPRHDQPFRGLILFAIAALVITPQTKAPLHNASAPGYSSPPASPMSRPMPMACARGARSSGSSASWQRVHADRRPVLNLPNGPKSRGVRLRTGAAPPTLRNRYQITHQGDLHVQLRRHHHRLRPRRLCLRHPLCPTGPQDRLR